MTPQLKTDFLKARKLGCPIIGIATSDPFSTVASLSAAMTNGDAPPILAWNIVEGMRPQNTQARTMLTSIGIQEASLPDATINATEMLATCKRLGEHTCVFMYNAHLFFHEPPVIQGIMNLRDALKVNRRTLVLLGPAMRLPVELEKDVLTFEEPLPGDEELGVIADNLYALIGTTTKFPKAMREQTVRASKGLSPFSAEQAIAMSLTKNGIDTEQLWNHKKSMIEQVRGLTVVSDNLTFNDVGGLDAIKAFGKAIFNGPQPPSVVCWIDEIEKSLGGSSGPIGDSSGVSQDALGVVLKSMEETDATGLIAVGPPGAGKSLLAKALGNTYHVPTIFVDLGAAKGSLVGQSETRIRDMMRTLHGIAGQGRTFFIATANRLDAVPPELRRRFRFGTWMFPLPDSNERETIWQINLKKYGLVAKGYARPVDEGLTGAEIRSVCELSWRLSCDLKAAMHYITPISKSDPDSVARLYKAADGRFLSASHGGVFTIDASKTGSREVSL